MITIGIVIIDFLQSLHSIYQIFTNRGQFCACFYGHCEVVCAHIRVDIVIGVKMQLRIVLPASSQESLIPCP